MDRLAYVLRRLAQVVPVVLGVTMLTFLLVHLLPGDPAGAVLGNRATPELVAQLHAKWGLDRSLPEQYWLFVQRLAHGDLGDSLLYGDSVRSMVIQRTPVTLWLLVYGTVLAILIAVPLATVAARRKDGAVDQVVRAVPLVGLGMPSFWLGIMLILLFAAGQLEDLPRRRLRRRRRRTPGEHVPAGADGRHRHRPAAHTQPARQPARRARIRLHHDGARQGNVRAPRARPPCPAQRAHADGHRPRHQPRLPDRQHGRGREGVRAARASER